MTVGLQLRTGHADGQLFSNGYLHSQHVALFVQQTATYVQAAATSADEVHVLVVTDHEDTREFVRSSLLEQMVQPQHVRFSVISVKVCRVLRMNNSLHSS